MLFLKYLLMWGGIGMILAAAGMLTYDLYLELLYRRARRPLDRVRCRRSRTFAGGARWRWGSLAWGPMLLALGIVVVPAGMAGVRVSQTSGTLAGTLYPGVHFVTPLVENVVLFDTRDQLFTTGEMEDATAKQQRRKRQDGV